MRDLSRLLRPRSIAVIGGGFWGGNVVRQCRSFGFAGPIWPVHPTRHEVGGEPAVATLAALPAAPDAVFIGVNRILTIQMVADLAAMGAGGATCFASGFREAQQESNDGADLQEQLLVAAGEMPILGPNCYGLINYLDQVVLWPDQHGGVKVDRGVAIVTQSSNIAINLTMQKRALPLAYVVTVGNQAQTGLAEIGLALLNDSRVTALGLYIEGVGDLRAFEALSHAAHAMGKPLLAVKTGRSPQAQAGAVSHTASLAGSDAGGRALLARLGVAEASGLSTFLETLKLLHMTGPLGSNRIGSLSCSGGEASLMADTALELNLEFPPLGEYQMAALRRALGPMVALANPLDYHTYIWGDTVAMTATMAAVMMGDLALTCIVVDFPRADRCDPVAWQCVIDAVVAAKAGSDAPVALISSLADTMPEDVAQNLMAQGVVPLCGIEAGLKAIELAASLGGDWGTASAPILLPGPARKSRVIDEAAAKGCLQAYGVPVPKGVVCSSLMAVMDQAVSLGFPLVLKGLGHAHKSELGAVRINLTTEQALAEAATAIDSARYLVERMVTAGVAELLIGVLRDPAHGFVLTLGAGGVLTEVLSDTTSRLLPVTRQDVLHALAELKLYPLLCGYRGNAAADLDAVVEAVLAVQRFVLASAALLEEVEINPLICTPTQAVAVDALIRMGVEDDRDTD